MKKFKVLVIQLLLQGNQIAEYGDEVAEVQLMSKSEDLVKSGFIKPLKSKDIVEEEASPVVEEETVETVEDEVSPVVEAKKGAVLEALNKAKK